MDKDPPKRRDTTDDTPPVDSLDDDCGLSDLARDQFTQLERTSDQNRSARTNHNK
jgi:hypothetical protein